MFRLLIHRAVGFDEKLTAPICLLWRKIYVGGSLGIPSLMSA